MKTQDSARTAGHCRIGNCVNSFAVAFIGASLCLAAVDARAKAVKDAGYCKRAGEWAERELKLRVSDRKRTPADAIGAFGPDQLASKAFFANYATNVVYDESFEVYDRLKGNGDAEAAKRVLDFKLESMREVAEELCNEELGE
ncbi:hypothetical protein [Lysobacter capsici]|uniref:hypothetical protein n=1 Tax=Lysobacter capsici TaxID=435897 RepID=UPI001C002C7C|nr:hypothetical protein [Lysobacter capsici]QWF18602.1 hypothetical protein KME82_07605 [Lysobacter capsici]